MKTANIIVLAGQSNAVGVGYVKYLQKHFTTEKTAEFINGYPNIPINFFSHNFKSDGFVPTRVCCAQSDKETFGPEVSIAEQLSLRYPNDNIYIVKCAVGATSLYGSWLLPDGRCYKELLEILSDSIKHLEEKGYIPKIKAFCWMQGESDADTEEHTSQYISLYDNMLKNFNLTFEKYLDNCIYLDGGISEVWHYYKEINESKMSYAKSHKNHYYIDTIANGLTTKNEPENEPDIYHYDSDSVIKLGRLFADKIRL